MTDRALPGLSLKGFWAYGEDHWNTDMDANLLLLSSVVQGVALSQTTALPGSPTDGMIYIVPHGAGTNPDKIAVHDNGAWVYVTPLSGWAMWVADVSKAMRFNGTTWAQDVYVTALASLTDVLLSSPANGQVLTFDSGTSKWKNVTPVTGVATLAALTDVNVTEGAGIDGFSLKWNNATSKWIASAVAAGGGGALVGVNDQTASYTTVLSDANKMITMTSALGTNITIPPNSAVAYPIDTVIEIVSLGTGVPTLTPGVGVTLDSFNGRLALPGQYATARIVKVATDTWSVTVQTGTLVTALSTLTDVNVTEGAGINNYVLYWNNAASKWGAKALATVATSGAYSDLSGLPSLVTTLAALSDVNVTEGSGINNYALTWNNASGKWIAAAGTGSPNLSGLSDVNVTEGAGIDGEFLQWNNATSRWIAATPPSGGGVALTPPVYSTLTAYRNLGGATITQRTSGGVKSLSVISGGADTTLYAAMQTAPVGSFSMVCKSKTTYYGTLGGYHGAGICTRHSGSGYFESLHIDNNFATYQIEWTSTTVPLNINLGSQLADFDFFQHIDYDGTNLKFGISRNGIDILNLWTRAVSVPGTITEVGIFWGSTNAVQYTFEHFHVGALGTNGLP